MVEMKTLTIAGTTYEVVDEQARKDIADLKNSSSGGSGVPGVNGGSGIVVSDVAPDNTSVLWVDTSDNSDDGLQEAVNATLEVIENGTY